MNGKETAKEKALRKDAEAAGVKPALQTENHDVVPEPAPRPAEPKPLRKKVSPKKK